MLLIITDDVVNDDDNSSKDDVDYHGDRVDDVDDDVIDDDDITYDDGNDDYGTDRDVIDGSDETIRGVASFLTCCSHVTNFKRFPKLRSQKNREKSCGRKKGADPGLRAYRLSTPPDSDYEGPYFGNWSIRELLLSFVVNSQVPPMTTRLGFHTPRGIQVAAYWVKKQPSKDPRKNPCKLVSCSRCFFAFSWF